MQPFTCLDHFGRNRPVSFFVFGFGRATWSPAKAYRNPSYDPYFHDTEAYWLYPGKGYPKPAAAR